MLTDTQIIVLPYSSIEGNSVLEILIQELKNGKWNRFQAAVAFVKNSGMFDDLIDAIRHFINNNGQVSITCGADIFKGNESGSDYEAIEQLLKTIEDSEESNIYLYHETGRTFHPKIYFFSNEENQEAMLIMGSSNFTEGGLVNNIEANIVINFDLTKGDHIQEYEKLNNYFNKYWTETEEN